MFKMFWSLVCIVAFAVLGSSLPVEELTVLKEQPAEALFTTGKTPAQPFVLECITERATGKQIKYSWQKNGQPFNFESDRNIVQHHNEGSLVFLKPSQEIEGLYQCFAESDLGIATSRIISVKRTYLNAPKITPIKHKPVEGKTFKLECPVPDAYPKPKISWISQHGYDTNIWLSINDPRIITGPDGALYFTSITKKDALGYFKYVCLAKNEAVSEPVAIAEHSIEDVVQGDGKDSEFVAQYLSKDVVAKAGDVTRLYCIYGSVPLAHPDWFFEGKDVNGNPNDRVTRYNKSKGKILLIRDTYASDQGTYKCTVDNEVGKTQEHSIRLTVVSAPKYEKKPQPQIIVQEGDDVTIPCQVKGVGEPKISWTYNGKPVPSSKFSVSTDKSTGIVAADLVIEKVKKNDKGYYSCKAENEHGDIYAESLLFVK